MYSKTGRSMADNNNELIQFKFKKTETASHQRGIYNFRKKHIVKTQDFYEKHGKKTIVLARFMPIVRTFAPIVAGIGAMHYRSFMSYNLIGGFVWTFGITLLGFFLGKTLPAEQLDKYLLPIIGLIVVVSLLPSVIHVIKENRANK